MCIIRVVVDSYNIDLRLDKPERQPLNYKGPHKLYGLSFYLCETRQLFILKRVYIKNTGHYCFFFKLRVCVF